MSMFDSFPALRFAVIVILALFVLALLNGLGLNIERLWAVPGVLLAFGVFAYAGKIWRYRRASALFHLGIGIVILGGLVSWVDRKSVNLDVVVGDTVRAEPEWLSPMAVTFQELTKDYWPDGSLRDWRAAVRVRAAAGDSVAGTISANEPLPYRDSRIYLLKRGRAAVFQLVSAARLELGRVAFLFDAEKADSNVIYFPATVLKLTAGISELGDSAPLAVALYSADRLVGEARLAPGGELQFPAGAVRFKELTSWGTFTVVEDRGKNLVWLGFAAGLAGLASAFFRRSG